MICIHTTTNTCTHHTAVSSFLSDRFAVSFFPVSEGWRLREGLQPCLGSSCNWTGTFNLVEGGRRERGREGGWREGEKRGRVRGGWDGRESSIVIWVQIPYYDNLNICRYTGRYVNSYMYMCTFLLLMGMAELLVELVRSVEVGGRSTEVARVDAVFNMDLHGGRRRRVWLFQGCLCRLHLKMNGRHIMLCLEFHRIHKQLHPTYL